MNKPGGRTAGRAAPRRDEIAAVAAEALNAEISGAEIPGAETPGGSGSVGPVLAAGVEPAVRAALPAGSVVWNRFAGSGVQATPWPQDGAYGAGVVRLPGGWDAFRMTLHAVCARLPAGAPLWIYGGGEEGITSLDGRLDGLAEAPETVALKKRTRVLRLTRTATPARGAQADWIRCEPIAAPGVADPLPLRFYPGCFAAGRLDDGTRLLLENTPPLGDAARVLDFACGTGVVAAALRAKKPGLRLTLLDADATALAAAAENAPDAVYTLSDGLAGLEPTARFDLIVSNPPIHIGRQEDFSVLANLLEQGPKLLRPKGALVFVVQRTAGIGRLTAGLKRPPVKTAETPAFQVWRIG